jgi:hypothetical protein
MGLTGSAGLHGAPARADAVRIWCAPLPLIHHQAWIHVRREALTI